MCIHATSHATIHTHTHKQQHHNKHTRHACARTHTYTYIYTYAYAKIVTLKHTRTHVPLTHIIDPHAHVAQNSAVVGQSMKEACAINLSLFHLARVVDKVKALSDTKSNTDGRGRGKGKGKGKGKGEG